MFRTVSRLTGAALFAAVAGSVFAADDQALPDNSGPAADVVVNGQPISVNHVRLMSSGLDEQKNARQLNGDDVKNAARAELITEEVLAQAARKKGLDKQPDVADQIAY